MDNLEFEDKELEYFLNKALETENEVYITQFLELAEDASPHDSDLLKNISDHDTNFAEKFAFGEWEKA